MDPSAFNGQRLGNVGKALDDWRTGKRKGARSPWGPLIVLVVLVGVLLFVFHQVWQKNNWIVLKDVPSNQVEQVKNTVKELKFGFGFPTKLPFNPTSVSAQVTEKGSIQTIRIDFSNGLDTISEQVTNGHVLLSSIPLNGKESVLLPNSISAIAGVSGKYPQLLWNQMGFSYTLAVEQWKDTNQPSIGELENVYNNLTTIYP